MFLKKLKHFPKFYILLDSHCIPRCIALNPNKASNIDKHPIFRAMLERKYFLWKCSVRLISIFALRITTVSYSCQNTLFYSLCLCKARVLQGDGRNLASQQLERKQFARNLANLRFREKLSCQCQQPVCFIHWRLG